MSLRMLIQRGQQLFRVSCMGLRATTRPSLEAFMRQTREAFARMRRHTRETRFLTTWQGAPPLKSPGTSTNCVRPSQFWPRKQPGNVI